MQVGVVVGQGQAGIGRVELKARTYVLTQHGQIALNNRLHEAIVHELNYARVGLVAKQIDEAFVGLEIFERRIGAEIEQRSQ